LAVDGSAKWPVPRGPRAARARPPDPINRSPARTHRPSICGRSTCRGKRIPLGIGRRLRESSSDHRTDLHESDRTSGRLCSHSSRTKVEAVQLWGGRSFLLGVGRTARPSDGRDRVTYPSRPSPSSVRERPAPRTLARGQRSPGRSHRRTSPEYASSGRSFRSRRLGSSHIRPVPLPMQQVAVRAHGTADGPGNRRAMPELGACFSCSNLMATSRSRTVSVAR
jgi:hypothetical protein